jgi:hypothetical protein
LFSWPFIVSIGFLFLITAVLTPVDDRQALSTALDLLASQEMIGRHAEDIDRERGVSAGRVLDRFRHAVAERRQHRDLAGRHSGGELELSSSR